MLASVAIAGLAFYVLYRTFQRISVADVVRHMREMPAHVLLTAAMCAAGSFLVLALYEIAVVRYVKRPLGRFKPMATALIAFPLGHAIGQAMLSGGALRYRMYTPAGFSAMEVGATVLLCNLPYALAFGLLLDLSLVFGAERLAPVFRVGCAAAADARLSRAREGCRLSAAGQVAQGARQAGRLGRQPADAGDDRAADTSSVSPISRSSRASCTCCCRSPRTSAICRSWPCISRACWPVC